MPSLRYANTEGLQSAPCLFLHTLWGVGCLFLWGQAIVLLILGARKYSSAERDAIVRAVARFCLLASAGLAVVAYAVSSAPLGAPQSHARYLVGLLLVTPALLWPLWRGATNKGNSAARPWTKLFNRSLLLLIACAFLLGTGSTFGELPATQAANRQQDALLHDLLLMGATHIYTEYWTCDRIAFLSREEIICGVVDDNLQPSHNRDTRYYTIVSADPHSAYVFPLNSGQLPAVQQKIGVRVSTFMSRRNTGVKSLQNYTVWQRLVLDGYVVYLPIVMTTHH